MSYAGTEPGRPGFRATSTARRRLSRTRCISDHLMVEPALGPGWTGIDIVTTLLRFIVLIAIICGIAYGALHALATFYEPEQREITVTVPRERFGR